MLYSFFCILFILACRVTTARRLDLEKEGLEQYSRYTTACYVSMLRIIEFSPEQCKSEYLIAQGFTNLSASLQQLVAGMVKFGHTPKLRLGNATHSYIKFLKQVTKPPVWSPPDQAMNLNLPCVSWQAKMNDVDEVAVKRMKTASPSAADLALFTKEVQVLRSLHHRNIVQYYGACMEPGCLFFVTELMKGKQWVSALASNAQHALCTPC